MTQFDTENKDVTRSSLSHFVAECRTRKKNLCLVRHGGRRRVSRNVPNCPARKKNLLAGSTRRERASPLRTSYVGATITLDARPGGSPMTVLRRLVATAVLAAAVPCAGLAQSGKDSPRPREVGPSAEETDRLRRVVERYAETERDHVLKELGDLPGGPLGDDPDGWFDRLTGGGSVWERGPTMKGDIRQIFDRVATRLKVSEGRITRSEFRAYARQYLAADRSPPWREA